MGDRGNLRASVTAAALLGTALLGAVLPAAAQEATVVVAPGEALRAEAPPGTITTTPTGRYPETVEFRRAPGGDVIVVADLDIETYVAGIAEMPARWPLEALKAQAVAARTYAWFQMSLGTFQRRGFGYDICATTACQVYRGAEVVETPLVGARWQEAVDATAGEVLLFDGAPILARYFSTSGGQTWPNEVVFPSEGPRPYLVGGADPDDAVSPLHEWQVTFTRDQLDAILAEGRALSAATPFATIEDVPEDTPGRTEAVRVTGVDGTVVEVGAVAFRSFVSAVAPELFPDDFPGPRSDGRNLPTTIPSSRFTVDAGPQDQLIVLEGRGWGHGVGMGQYGALGKAERGLAHDEILAAYYNGLTPVTSPELPDRIRVGLQATSGTVEVRFNGPTPLRVGDRTLVEGALGTWTVVPLADGGVGAVAPSGWGDPIAVTATAASVVAPTPVEDVVLTMTTNKSVLVDLEVRTLEGELVASEPLGVVDAGSVEHRWSQQGDDDLRLGPGRYEVVLRATDETGASAGDPVKIDILALGGSGLPRPEGMVPAAILPGGGPPAAAVLGAGFVLGLALTSLVVRRRTR